MLPLVTSALQRLESGGGGEEEDPGLAALAPDVRRAIKRRRMLARKV